MTQDASLNPTGTLSPEDVEERRWIEAFRKGDRAAFEGLVRRHERAVRRVALRFAKDRDAADDLAQRAFIRAMSHVGELKGPFKPWLMRIVVNLGRNHVRDHARFIDAPLHEPSYEQRHDEKIDTERRREKVRQALLQLGERQREVVILRIDAQLSFAEIAAELGITENNAKVSYHHAVRRLRAFVGDENADV